MTSIYDHASFYDELFKPEPFLSWYYGLAANAFGPVLELACGTGQIIGSMHSLPNARYGIDLSEEMLLLANARNDAENKSKVMYKADDIRTFRTDASCDLIFIPRNSLLHMHTQEDFYGMFESVRRALSKNGVFAFDIFSPNPDLLSDIPTDRKMFSRVLHPTYGNVDVMATVKYNKESQVQNSDWHIIDASGNRIPYGGLNLRMVFPEELRSLLRANGFNLVERWGSFEKDIFSSDSARQVCICKAA